MERERGRESLKGKRDGERKRERERVTGERESLKGKREGERGVVNVR